jgi:hypothetical protein
VILHRISPSSLQLSFITNGGSEFFFGGGNLKVFVNGGPKHFRGNPFQPSFLLVFNSFTH